MVRLYGFSLFVYSLQAYFYGLSGITDSKLIENVLNAIVFINRTTAPQIKPVLFHGAVHLSLIFVIYRIYLKAMAS